MNSGTLDEALQQKCYLRSEK